MQKENFGKERKSVEALVIGVVKERRYEAHGGTHYPDSGADYRCLEQDGVSLAWVKDLACQLEGHGASNGELKGVCKHKLDQHHRPYRQVAPDDVNSAHSVYRLDDAGLSGDTHKRLSVHHIKTVKNVSVYRDDNGHECEHHSLHLCSWHKIFLPKAQKHAGRVQAGHRKAFRDQTYVPCTACVIACVLFACLLYSN